MKLQTLSTLTALVITGALSLAHAQTSSATATPTDTTTPSATTTAPSTTPSSMSSKDAAHALEEAKKACKTESSKQAQQDCVKKAQDDFKAANQAKVDATKSDAGKSAAPKQ